MVRISGYEYQNLGHEFLRHKLLAESVEMQWGYVISHVNEGYSGGSELEISRISWIQMLLYGDCILAANRGCMYFWYDC
jgi:hypothetical protein